ncbi:hypothetical protein [Pseudomonas sp.]|uniref:hypothetical protein n=1 Tax=Pseudomonas sp. TaxID=306 RepID=UPI0032639A79
MKKSHGPAFRRARTPMFECSCCRGTGLVSGVFHQMECANCNASGWLSAETGQALPLSDLVLELNLRLRDALAEISRARHIIGGAHEQYEQNNRRGAGGTNFTGD